MHSRWTGALVTTYTLKRWNDEATHILPQPVCQVATGSIRSFEICHDLEKSDEPRKFRSGLGLRSAKPEPIKERK